MRRVKPDPVEADTAVQPSRIHGNGLFATRVFLPGQFIGSYTGEYIDRERAYLLSVQGQNKFIFKLTDSLYIDGESLGNRLRWVNAPKAKRAPNAEFILEGESRYINLYARRKILPGEEITASYGDEYLV